MSDTSPSERLGKLEHRSQRLKLEGLAFIALFVALAAICGAQSISQATEVPRASVGVRDAQRPLSNEDVLRMLKAGLTPDIVIAKIKSSRCDFDTSPDALISLRAQNVPVSVIRAMVDSFNPAPDTGYEASSAPLPQQRPYASASESVQYVEVLAINQRKFYGPPPPPPPVPTANISQTWCNLFGTGLTATANCTTYSTSAAGGGFAGGFLQGYEETKAIKPHYLRAAMVEGGGYQFVIECVHEWGLIHFSRCDLPALGTTYTVRISKNEMWLAFPAEHAGVKKVRYVGIGIRFVSRPDETGKLVSSVIDTVAGSPAFRAGILPGDVIVEVDGKNAVGLRSSVNEQDNSLREMVQGPRGGIVHLTIRRKGSPEPIQFTIARGEIVQHIVKMDWRKYDIVSASVGPSRGVSSK